MSSSRSRRRRFPGRARRRRLARLRPRPGRDVRPAISGEARRDRQTDVDDQALGYAVLGLNHAAHVFQILRGRNCGNDVLSRVHRENDMLGVLVGAGKDRHSVNVFIED